MLGGSGILATCYLLKCGVFRADKYAVLGVVGLLTLAFGLATDAVVFPLAFYAMLLIGGSLIVLYSAIGLFYLKIKVCALWVVLNIIFIVNPLIMVLSLI